MEVLVKNILNNEATTLKNRGSKQALSDLKNLIAFSKVCKKYGLESIEVNAESVNIGIIAIELLKKILNKNYKSIISNHNDNNIIKVSGKLYQLGSYVISKPKQVKETSKPFEKVLILVHSNTNKGIYIVNKEYAINLNARMTLSQIINNGYKVMDF